MTLVFIDHLSGQTKRVIFTVQHVPRKDDFVQFRTGVLGKEEVCRVVEVHWIEENDRAQIPMSIHVHVVKFPL